MKLLIIFYIVLYSNIIANEYINDIINGNLDVFEKVNAVELNKNQHIFLNGLSETDGEKAKEYFVEYINTDDDIYDADAIMKVAEYYYSQGAYLQSSNWYKKVSLNYADYKNLDTAIDYYLNSLLIVGKRDSADYYTNHFKNKRKKIKFNNKLSNFNKESFLRSKAIVSDDLYSVQVGSYSSYQAAKKSKKILSREGFLCRIDTITRGYETFYAVRIGNFKNKNLATKEQKRLKYRIGIYDSIIVKIN